MVLIFQIVALLTNLYIFVNTLYKIKKELKAIYIVLFLFQIIFVIPIAFEFILGPQDFTRHSPGYQLAIEDALTNIIYSLFTVIVSISFYILGKRKMKTNIGFDDIKETLSKIKINRVLFILCSLLMFIPIVLLIFSPSPEKYLFEYAYFQRIPESVSEMESLYHNTIMRYAGVASLVFIVITRFFSKNDLFSSIVIYSAALVTGILNGKRTLFAWIILAILGIDILKSPRGKFPFNKVFLNGAIILGYFIGYAYLVDKTTDNLSSIDNLRLYFFRDFDVKFTIYSLINPNDINIIDYWGQSFLYNLTMFIPRDFWANKPYPYDIYVTAATLGYPTGTLVGWSFQTSFFGESLTNLGWFGIPFSIYVYKKIIEISERSRNPIIIALCIFIIVQSFMNHFGTFVVYFSLWLLLIIFNNISFKNNPI